MRPFAKTPENAPNLTKKAILPSFAPPLSCGFNPPFHLCHAPFRSFEDEPCFHLCSVSAFRLCPLALFCRMPPRTRRHLIAHASLPLSPRTRPLPLLFPPRTPPPVYLFVAARHLSFFRRGRREKAANTHHCATAACHNPTAASTPRFSHFRPAAPTKKLFLHSQGKTVDKRNDIV